MSEFEPETYVRYGTPQPASARDVSRKNRNSVLPIHLQEELEYEKKVGAQDEFDILGGTEKELAKKKALSSAVMKETENRALGAIASSLVEDLIGPPKDSVGMKLMRLMGWREGQGVGPRKKRQLDVDDGCAGVEHTVAPRPQAPVFDLKAKTNDCGLGFDPFKNSKEMLKVKQAKEK
ncbi:hypothetical protein HDU67_000687, partial [Dinochytrium kinnereticum]